LPTSSESNTSIFSPTHTLSNSRFDILGGNTFQKKKILPITHFPLGHVPSVCRRFLSLSFDQALWQWIIYARFGINISQIPHPHFLFQGPRHKYEGLPSGYSSWQAYYKVLYKHKKEEEGRQNIYIMISILTFEKAAKQPPPTSLFGRIRQSVNSLIAPMSKLWSGEEEDVGPVISAPQAFTHTSHIGYNKESGKFEVENIPEDWREKIFGKTETKEQVEEKRRRKLELLAKVMEPPLPAPPKPPQVAPSMEEDEWEEKDDFSSSSSSSSYSVEEDEDEEGQNLENLLANAMQKKREEEEEDWSDDDDDE